MGLKMKRYEQFGKVIRRMREMNKMTQVGLAEKIGASGQEVSNSERGMAALPKPKLQRLIKVLHVSEKERRRIINALANDAAKFERERFRDI